MKNQLETLFIILLRIWLMFLFGLLIIESIIVILDMLGYEYQIEKIIDYISL